MGWVHGMSGFARTIFIAIVTIVFFNLFKLCLPWYCYSYTRYMILHGQRGRSKYFGGVRSHQYLMPIHQGWKLYKLPQETSSSLNKRNRKQSWICKELKTFAKNIKQTTPLAPRWLPTDQFLRSTRCGPNEGMSHAHYTEYMSQLNLPGSAQGSYSKKWV